MSIWLAFWIVLMLVFVGFVAWTTIILVRQKSAWKEYADKRKLRYNRGSLMQSPDVQGIVNDHRVTIFTSEHLSEDMRGSRKLTAIEISLNSKMPITGGVASGNLIPVLKGMALRQEYAPKHKSWNKAYLCTADSRTVMEHYLTDERITALTKLMQIKHSWIILVFRDDRMLLRIDTADPLDSAAAVDKMVKRLLKTAEILELGNGESKVLKSDAVKAKAESVSLELDEETFDTGAIQLEEDENDSPSDDIKENP